MSSLTFRNRPLEALRALSQLAKDPDDLPRVFKIIEALPGRTPDRMLKRFRADSCGARLLDARPNLGEQLTDRAALMALPEGTLGREYAELTARTGISPQGIVEASIAGTSHTRDGELGFIDERMRDTHDLWHVVTGYGVDVVGEVALLAFIYAQTGHPGVGLICGLSFLEFLPGANSAMAEAYRRGRRAAWLPTVAWEELLDRPLDEVRAILGVGDPPTYVPISSDAVRGGRAGGYRALLRKLRPGGETVRGGVS